VLKTISSIVNAIGALNYKGVWNASTNSPALASGVGSKGDYYVVSVAGNTNLDGTTLWGVGDWAAFNGTVWQKVDGGSTGNFTTIDVTQLATLANVNITSATANTAAMPDPSLPLNPEGYVTVQIGGVNKKIPYYGV
jgi:hypothetical protein